MNETTEQKSRLLTLVVQLVVIPLSVVVFCVGLGALFMWMTSERKDFDGYVKAVEHNRGPGGRGQQAQYLLNYIQESKRWQDIFDVTAQMTATNAAFTAQHPQAVGKLARIFEESREQDPKTRRYLALVLGMLGDKAALPVLRGGLDDGDAETVKNCVLALGWLGDSESALRIIELTRHAEQSVRLVATCALGSLEHPQARAVLAASLGDADELVQWNAAFGLAHRQDAAAGKVLERLLDKEYVDRHVELSPENRQRYRVAAVVMLAKLQGAAVEPVLRPVSVSDADLAVRNAALKELNNLKSK